jgi:hypothetical protein
MEELIKELIRSANPLIVLVGLLLVYVVTDLKKKMKKFDGLDELLFEIRSLSQQLSGLRRELERNRTETDTKMREVEKAMREIFHRLVKLETKEQLREMSTKEN